MEPTPLPTDARKPSLAHCPPTPTSATTPSAMTAVIATTTTTTTPTASTTTANTPVSVSAPTPAAARTRSGAATSPSISINTHATTTSSSQEAIRTHTYWSGFYKKTIKERRTQLGLAFPHLARPSSLDSFASTQTSAKTSGQSTPNFGPTRSLTMTSIVVPTTTLAPPSSSSGVSSLLTSTVPLVAPQPISMVRSTASPHHHHHQHSHLNNNSTAVALHLSPSDVTSSVNTPDSSAFQDVSSLLNYTDDGQISFEQANGHHLEHDQQEQDHIMRPNKQAQEDEDQDSERRALALELAQGQEDVAMTEEERRDQLEKERKATVISNLAEQRKMIGSPNGHLLEGDLSLDARLDAIIATEQEGAPFPVYGLDEQIANNMIENCIGTLGLPMGLAFNFTINGNPLVIPMAIEEPSVIAAVSSAAKTISTYQGFQATAPERNMIIAQVQLLDIKDADMDRVMAKMQEQEKAIQEEANEYCTNMVMRGGGVQRVSFHRVRRHISRESFKGQALLVKYGVISPQNVPSRTQLGLSSQGRCSEWLVVHLHIDVGDAMGANCANTVAEGIAPFLAKMSGGRIGVRILSNLNVDRIAKSTFRLPFSHMGYKSLPGKDVAVRLLEAYEWADLDPYRAATHNKGIMNGIDAVALATGQDWRAIEAGAHAWASGAGTYSDRSSEHSSLNSKEFGQCGLEQQQQNGSKRKFGHDTPGGRRAKISRGDAYKPLTRYWVEEDEERLAQGFKGQDALVFCGELEMPIMVGTKGGVLSTNPVHAFTLGVMRYPDSKQLAMAMVTVGLAQNFAALRALVTEGIQRGHMALHARNIAISAGTPPASVDEVTAHMIDTGRIRLGAARSYIEKRGLGLYSVGMSANSSNISVASSSVHLHNNNNNNNNNKSNGGPCRP